MLFRALFWIGVVAVLLPREPDLGLGCPDTGAANDAIGIGTGAARQFSEACGAQQWVCNAGVGLLASIQQNTARDLAQVKAEIEADQRARAGG